MRLSFPITQKPMFNYIKYWQYISQKDVKRIVEHVVIVNNKQSTKNTNSSGNVVKLAYNLNLVEKLIWKMIMMQSDGFKYLNPPDEIPITYCPGSLLCLSNLYELECSSKYSETLLLGLAHVCQNIYRLTINPCEDNENNGLFALIEQQNSLREVKLVSPKGSICKQIGKSLAKQATSLTNFTCQKNICLTEEAMSKLVNIRELDLILGRTNLKSNSLELAKFAKLRVLNINHQYRTALHHYTKIIETTEGDLEKINFDFGLFPCIEEIQRYIQVVTENCPNLKFVTIWFTGQELNDIERLLIICNKLQTIKIEAVTYDLSTSVTWKVDIKPIFELLTKTSKNFQELIISKWIFTPLELNECLEMWRGRKPLTLKIQRKTQEHIQDSHDLNWDRNKDGTEKKESIAKENSTSKLKPPSKLLTNPTKNITKLLSPPIENEGIKLESENWITCRHDTLRKIDKFLQRDKLILVRSPPFTGKTSLCFLLENYYCKLKIPVVHVCFLGVQDYRDFEKFWINETSKSWKYWLDPKKHCGELVIILDETQLIFNNRKYEDFWSRVKYLSRLSSSSSSTIHKKKSLIKVIAFSTVASIIINPNTDDINNDRSLIGGRTTRNSSGRVSNITQSPVDFQNKFGFELIRCTKKELLELAQAFNNHCIRKKIQVSEKIAGYIMDFTAGHVGLIRWILKGIDNHFSYRGTIYEVTTDSQIMRYLKSSEFIEQIKSHRGAAPLYKFTKEQGEIIDKLLLKDEIYVSASGPDDVMTSLLKTGVIFYLDDKGPEFRLREGRVGFISPVNKLLSFFQRCVSMKEPLKDGFGLQELIKEALSRINSKALTHNLGRSKDGMRLLERVWQMEFYRAIYSCLPDEMHISPDVGRIFSTDGVVDFYISEPQWAIELLIDGIDMKRHHERFQDGGRYSLIPIKSYLILDIRETRTVQKSYPNTWHITPNSDFSIFNVLAGTNIFDIPIRKVYPSLLISKNLSRKKNRKEVIESLEKLIDFLTRREKYLRERGTINEANDVQRQLDRAAHDLTHVLYEAVGQGFGINGDLLLERYYRSIINNDINNNSSTCNGNSDVCDIVVNEDNYVGVNNGANNSSDSSSILNIDDSDDLNLDNFK
ncbi:10895_t:CDS:2 [Entrophospora sp. SA101]|nr:10895_t:CDS:2 [Entrophospora sp. SA101]